MRNLYLCDSCGLYRQSDELACVGCRVKMAVFKRNKQQNHGQVMGGSHGECNYNQAETKQED